MTKLTKKIVDLARPQPTGETFVWCGYTHGFAVRVYPSGRKIFIIQLRVNGRTRRCKIGAYGPFTVDQARTRAETFIRAAAEGRDPQQEKRDAKQAPTVKELCERYMADARAGIVTTRFKRPKRLATVAIDEGRIARHIVPLVGHKLARDIRTSDVQELADKIAQRKTAGVFKGKPRGKAVVKGGPGTAGRVVGVLGGIFTWAIRRGHVPGPNPVRGVEVFRYEPRDRVLTHRELGDLGKVLKEKTAGELRSACDALKLIALAGLRRQEACCLRWAEIDYHSSCLRLSETKTGRSVRPIGSATIDHLKSVPVRSKIWVFPNMRDDGGADLKHKIALLFEGAGLTDARSHDMRRTFASVAAEMEWSEGTIMELLGHAARSVTSRHYIRRPDAALRSAASAVAEHIGRALAGETAEVIGFPSHSPSVSKGNASREHGQVSDQAPA